MQHPIPKYCKDWRLEDPVEAVLPTCSTSFAFVNADSSQVIQILHYSVKDISTSSRFAGKGDTISHPPRS